MIKIERLSKTYYMGNETVHALQDISLHIYPGDLAAIIGPSGSGKSTLMNMIGCLDIPDTGEYYLEDQEVSRLSENELAEVRNAKIGFIFQQYNLLPRLTALENVELPLIYRGLPLRQRQKMAEAALERMGLSDRIHHKPSELSGGQQQRVSVARALAGEPSLLLADEPTGALDQKTGRQVMKLFSDLHEEGHTIIMITHDISIAQNASRIVRILDGELSEGAGEDA